MTPKQDAARLAKSAESQGFTVRRTSRGHYQFFTADGIFVCDLGGTPSSNQEVTRKKAKLRQHGLRN